MSDHVTHIPVLLDETIEWLKPKQNEVFVDGTVGQGGHSEAILRRTAPHGRLLAIDRDPRNLLVAKSRLANFGDRVVFLHASYAEVARLAREHGIEQVNGALIDIGFSSAHIEEASRGFSFQLEGPLDMRYDTEQSLTAAEIVNTWNTTQLTDLFRIYGEERYAREIAETIVQVRTNRPFATTTELADVIAARLRRRGKIHPATQVFQALRIAVNDELGELERALPELIALLKPGGRLAVISFHSLEDRIVKRFFAQRHGVDLNVLTKHVVKPTEEEIKRNPRSRSAKLRVVEKR